MIEKTALSRIHLLRANCRMSHNIIMLFMDAILLAVDVSQAQYTCRIRRTYNQIESCRQPASTASPPARPPARPPASHSLQPRTATAATCYTYILLIPAWVSRALFYLEAELEHCGAK